MAKKSQENLDEQKIVDQLDEFLKQNKDKHLGSRSGTEIEKPDIISTGSYLFDRFLGGGFRSSSWVRFCAPPETGKSSAALCWGKQWQDYYKKLGKIGKVIFFNAEGRLHTDLIERSGIDTSKEYFRLIDANLSEFIYDMIEHLVYNNPNDIRYFFVVDSTDACVKLIDKDKKFEESEKMGGTSSVLSAAGRRLSLIFSRKNHVMYMCSQVRDNLKSSHGGKQSSGGWSPKFYSSLTANIETPSSFNDGFIFENPSDKDSKVIGRLTTYKFEKTWNEKTGQKIQVPIKYGLIGGVWRAYEGMMVAQERDFITRKGSWYYIHPALSEGLLANNISFEEKWQGEKQLRDYLDTNPEMVNFILERDALLTQ